MILRYGKENLTRLSVECEFGPGTASRLKKMETSVGLDILEKLAAYFYLEPWQLLVPNFDPKSPPKVREFKTPPWPLPMVDKDRFFALPEESRLYIQGYIGRLVEEHETRNVLAAGNANRA